MVVQIADQLRRVAHMGVTRPAIQARRRPRRHQHRRRRLTVQIGPHRARRLGRRLLDHRHLTRLH